MTNAWRRLAAVVLALLGAGCLVQIDHVGDPRPAFDQARAEARRYQGRRGPAHQLNVLVYDVREQKLVRVRVPMWLAKKVAAKVDWDEVDLDSEDADQVKRVLKRHLSPGELDRAGLGVLVEVEDDDGEQVLVWLR